MSTCRGGFRRWQNMDIIYGRRSYTRQTKPTSTWKWPRRTLFIRCPGWIPQANICRKLSVCACVCGEDEKESDSDYRNVSDSSAKLVFRFQMPNKIFGYCVSVKETDRAKHSYGKERENIKREERRKRGGETEGKKMQAEAEKGRLPLLLHLISQTGSWLIAAKRPSEQPVPAVVHPLLYFIVKVLYVEK